jgi:hypothetical protein
MYFSIQEWDPINWDCCNLLGLHENTTVASWVVSEMFLLAQEDETL